MKILGPGLALVVFLLASCGPNLAQQKPVVALQPLDTFEPALIQRITNGIKTHYEVEVVLLGKKEMPKEAFYPPRNRYRAEQILPFLDRVNDRGFTKIVGLTKRDISTTKGEYVDWGIMGLGLLGQRPCVVSTFRLGRNKVAEGLFLARLEKIVNHELGHTFGLDHCPNVGCYMEDVQGKVKTVDAWNGELCPACRKKLPLARSGK